jgi:hypothetical protein
MNPIATRWLIRTAYGIPGSDCSDLLAAWCCPCCSVNQLYQTTKAYGAPTPDAGRLNNTGAFMTQSTNENCCKNCMYACCCCPCALGTTMNNAVDMPFWMGCCCVSMCAARNIVRYQYRIGGDDCCDDYAVPMMIGMLTYMLNGVCPCAMFCTMPYFLNIIMKMLGETDTRSVKGNHPKQYLASNNPAMATATSYPMAIPAGVPVYANVPQMSAATVIPISEPVKVQY